MSFDSSYQGHTDTVTLTKPNLLLSCIHHSLDYHKTKYPALKDLTDISIQQALITKDLLFVLIGLEGHYIRFSSKYNPTDLESSILGPEFKIAKSLDISLKLITKKVIKYGRYYCSLNNFLENYNNETFGKVVQNLCYSIVQFKSKYERLVVELEQQFKYNSNFNLSTLDNMLNEISNPMKHYYDIINLIHTDTIERYRSEEKQLRLDEKIDLFIDPTKFNVCKGGLVLKIIQSRIKAFKGDVSSTKFLIEMYEQVSKDYLNSLNEWLANGIIDDPFNEFLIKQTNFQSFLTPKMQIYWDEIYKIRYDGLIDQFTNKDIQSKILLTGKYLNIFKYCCGLENLDSINDNIGSISSIFNQNFELKVNHYYKRANKLLMKLIFEGYNFTEIVNYYKEIYLLDNSSIDKFISTNFNDLAKNKFKISVSKLTKNFNNLKRNNSEIKEILNDNLEFSVNSLNFYELAKEVLNIEPITNIESQNIEDILGSRSKLTSSTSTRIEESEANQLSVASINLNLDLPFPLNLIINYNFNLQYQLIFNNQLFIKFIDQFVDNTWKEVNSNPVWKYQFENVKMSKWILRSRVLLNRMRDFINELQYYLSSEIINKNHNEFSKSISRINEKLKEEPLESTFSESNNSFKGVNNNYNGLFNKITAVDSADEFDLNNLVNSMSTYLNNILRDSFLAHEQIMNDLSKLLQLVILYNQFLTKLKTSLILSDKQLFEQYKANYPETFKDLNDESMVIIYDNLNEELNKFYEGFNMLLTQFMSSINSNLDNTSQQFLNFFESLENSFPN